jgi:hypothetical protein
MVTMLAELLPARFAVIVFWKDANDELPFPKGQLDHVDVDII